MPKTVPDKRWTATTTNDTTPRLNVDILITDPTNQLTLLPICVYYCGVRLLVFAGGSVESQ